MDQLDQATVDRFWAKVQKRPGRGCWNWTAATLQGYGIFRLDGGTMARAHRVAYELLVGPIPDGLTLDHLCRNPGCVKPSHLEPVTLSENVRRAHANKARCKHGHLFTEENTRRLRNGRRECRECRQYASHRLRMRKLGRKPMSRAKYTKWRSREPSGVAI